MDDDDRFLVDATWATSLVATMPPAGVEYISDYIRQHSFSEYQEMMRLQPTLEDIMEWDAVGITLGVST